MVADRLAQEDSLETKDVEELKKLFSKDRSPEVFLPLAKAYLLRGYPLEAAAVLEKGLKGASSREGEVMLAQAYLDASITPSKVKNKYLNKAGDLAEQLIAGDANDFHGYRIKGEVAEAQGDVNNAIAALKKAHELNPSHPQAGMLLKSMNQDLDSPMTPPPGKGPFFIETDTYSPALETDSLLKAIRDVVLFSIVILVGVYMYAGLYVHRAKIHALIVLGRTQQNIHSISGLKRARKVYTKVLNGFDKKHPFALIHLSEVAHSIWKYHNHKEGEYNSFVSRFTEVKATKYPLLPKLADYQALRYLVQYEAGIKDMEKGDLDAAKTKFQSIADSLKEKEKKQKFPPHARISWVHGLALAGLRKDRYAGAYFKRAADIGWKNVMFRMAYAVNYYRVRKFSSAHNQYKQAIEQAKQSKVLVTSELSDFSRMKNAYCWIDPPMLFDSAKNPPKGLELTTQDLLFDSLVASIKATVIPKCNFHPFFWKRYKATKHSLMAPIGDALSVLLSGVGQAEAFKMIEKVEKEAKKVKKIGDLSPRYEGWLYYTVGQKFWYQGKFAKAAEYAAKAVKVAGWEPALLAFHGVNLGRAGKFDEAFQQFSKAFKLDPYLIQPYYDAANFYLNQKKNEQAEKVLNEMKKHFAEHADYIYLLGRLARNKGDEKKAITLWKKALESDRAPTYGDHYEANVELGKLAITKGQKLVLKVKKGRGRRAKMVPRKRFKKDEYPGYFAQLKEEKDRYLKKLKDRYTKKEDLEKELERWNKFYKALEEGKKVKAADLVYYLGYLRELYFEDAGSYMQSALGGRPGAAGARYYLGIIYFSNERYNDSNGHFTIAAKGYTRDREYKMAAKCYKYLNLAIIRSEKKKEAGVLKATNDLKKKALFLLKAQWLKLTAEKAKLMAQEKRDEANKLKTKPKVMTHIVAQLNTLADSVEGIDELKEVAETIRNNAKFAQTNDVFKWAKEKQKELMPAKDDGKGKKRRRRRRRRRRTR